MIGLIAFFGFATAIIFHRQIRMRFVVALFAVVVLATLTGCAVCERYPRGCIVAGTVATFVVLEEVRIVSGPPVIRNAPPRNNTGCYGPECTK